MCLRAWSFLTLGGACRPLRSGHPGCSGSLLPQRPRHVSLGLDNLGLESLRRPRGDEDETVVL